MRAAGDPATPLNAAAKAFEDQEPFKDQRVRMMDPLVTPRPGQQVAAASSRATRLNVLAYQGFLS